MATISTRSDMTAEIERFKSCPVDRIAQLTNKTNQFNLTTRRYTRAEMEVLLADRNYIGLYGKLKDRFGDHGLITVVLGRQNAEELHIDLWLMSCRVLKRTVEIAMLDAIAERAIRVGIKRIIGYYVPTRKNSIVADLYPNLGFLPCASPMANPTEGATLWTLDLSNYAVRCKHIKVTEYVNV